MVFFLLKFGPQSSQISWSLTWINPVISCRVSCKQMLIPCMVRMDAHLTPKCDTVWWVYSIKTTGWLFWRPWCRHFAQLLFIFPSSKDLMKCVSFIQNTIYIYIHIECVWVSSKSCLQIQQPLMYRLTSSLPPKESTQVLLETLRKTGRFERSATSRWERHGAGRVETRWHSFVLLCIEKWQLLHVLRFQGRCLRVLLGNAPEQFLDGDDSSPASKLWDDDTVSAHFSINILSKKNLNFFDSCWTFEI